MHWCRLLPSETSQERLRQRVPSWKHLRELGFAMDRRIVSVTELARLSRSGPIAGCTAAVVSWTGRSGSIRVVGINVGWDGAVYAAGFLGQARWTPEGSGAPK